MTNYSDIAHDDDWFINTPVPGQPDWSTWAPHDQNNYNVFLGVMHVRKGGDGLPDTMARVRMFPQIRHRNLADVVHGGTMMGFIDCALFGAMRVLQLGLAGPSVTVDLQTQFVGAAQMDAFLEARVEAVKETGSLLFMRGLVVQGDAAITVASFSGIIKKARPAAA